MRKIIKLGAGGSDNIPKTEEKEQEERKKIDSINDKHNPWLSFLLNPFG